jgi:hypothetical protein
MKRLATLLLFPLAALAQHQGPAAGACRTHATQDLARENARIKAVEFDRDVILERYARKAGSQLVRSLLAGNGAIMYASGPAVEMSFVCLLADDGRAVFFHWMPRRDAPVLAQCRRGGADPGACLDSLLQMTELELTQLYAGRFVEARDADSKAGNEGASNAFRRAAESWRAYRDAECARRPEGDARKACLVDLTRRRALDLR